MEELILNSQLYKDIAEGRDDIKIWDDKYTEDGWVYWNIVSSNSGVVKKMAYLRLKENIIQKRTYDDEGDDLWIVVQ